MTPLYTPLRVFFARVCEYLVGPEVAVSRRATCPSKLEEKTRATKLDEEGNGGDSRKIPLATLTIVSPLGGGERTREWRERERGRER